jgi:hypothetical protein
MVHTNCERGTRRWRTRSSGAPTVLWIVGTHAEFTIVGIANGRVERVAITFILVGLAFHMTEKIRVLHPLLTRRW